MQPVHLPNAAGAGTPPRACAALPPVVRHIARAGPVARLAVLVVLGTAPAACGGSRDADASVVRTPARAGEVWEVDRANAPAALRAFVDGMHVVVVDGDAVFGGMRALHAERTATDARRVRLPDSSEAQLATVGDALELRFADGERALLRRRAPRAAGAP